ncbi:hypothetical protein PROFUN_00932 [Planoprotostelium fungivorum]|uniref:Enoyl-CoA hydratase domain-containing protein 3, mitochondrial n=1 Tax=Planoprotostelium fungivorum TaxID=1890364 RepID=A0A2P6N475_9EUKA|nr:hypothetical protein PROFUN_00932 [Planoprotostelium fungivorum]
MISCAADVSIRPHLLSRFLRANTKDGVTTLLPDFLPSQLPPRDSIQDRWLWDSEEWRKQRGGLPSCLVIATEGPVFSSGHDLSEMKGKPKEEIKEIFDLCSEVMSLIRRSPSVVISRINGIATAAGAQLAATTDIVIASPSSSFGTPGVRVGLYCTTPGVAVARAFPPKTAFGMLATARTLSAKEAHEKGMVTFLSKVEGEGEVHALDQLVHDVALDITSSGSQIQALGKWSFYTQIGMREGGGDGMEAAVKWAGEIMARNAKLDDAKEGFSAFLEKRKPSWKT